MVTPLISSLDLAALVGLTAGTNINSSSWLSFILDDKKLYIPQHNIRHNVNWNQLNALSLVYGKEIVINDQTYLCRLLRIGDSDPFSSARVNELKLEPHVSEFTRLYLPLLNSSVYNGRGYTYTGPKYANFTASSFATREQSFWCMETNSLNTSQAFIVGFGWSTPSITDIRAYDKTSATNVINSGGAYTLYRCWRPVLELIDT